MKNYKKQMLTNYFLILNLTFFIKYFNLIFSYTNLKFKTINMIFSKKLIRNLITLFNNINVWCNLFNKTILINNILIIQTKKLITNVPIGLMYLCPYKLKLKLYNIINSIIILIKQVLISNKLSLQFFTSIFTSRRLSI